MIFPLCNGVVTISLVTSLHLLQTQPQTTTFRRCGQRSSLSSNRRIISPSSSGNIVDHETPFDAARSKLSDGSTPVRRSSSRRSFALCTGCENLKSRSDFEIVNDNDRRERNDFLTFDDDDIDMTFVLFVLERE